MRTFRRLLAALAVLATAAAVSTVAPAGAGAARPYCGITWGSLAKARDGSGMPITGIRAGRHGCYDRLVIDLAGPSTGYRVAYVRQVLDQARGEPVPVRGGAALDVTVFAPAYDADGRPTVSLASPPSVAGYRTFRQVASGGSFEGQTTIALGVRARLPVRVFTLRGPGAGSRLVIDVAHRW